MGRKSKLKKQRQLQKQNKTNLQANEPENFIGQMAKEGYHFHQLKRSPEVPKDNVEPQV